MSVFDGPWQADGETVAKCITNGQARMISGDAEPRERLIRCKDCKFYDAAIHSCGRLDRLAGAFMSYVFDDDFCCWAKPKEDR